MSLTDAATAHPQPSRVCWAQTLPPKLREELDDVEALQDEGHRINRTAIWRELNAQGVAVSESAVLNHFRRDCKCR